MSSEIQQRIVELDNGLAESEMQLLAAAERLQALREAKNEKDSDSDDDDTRRGGEGGAIAMLEKLRLKLDAHEEELSEMAISTKAEPGEQAGSGKKFEVAPPRPLYTADGPDSATIERLLRWEMIHQLDEDGTGELVVGPSTFPGGGLGAFATRKPAPLEYKRDLNAPNEGWLTQEECDEGWDKKTPWSTYIMEVTLGADWFRDEVEMRGLLRPMQHLHEYVKAGRMAQNLKWNHETTQYTFVDPKHHYCFRGYMDPKANPAPYINDALFGKCDGESDQYEAQDEVLNAFLMIPCLRRSSQGQDKVELNSVWYYPRPGWRWTPDQLQEVTCGYHWPLEPWMTSDEESGVATRAAASESSPSSRAGC